MVSVEESIEISAPAERVWEVFSKVEDWPTWWDGCLDADAPQSLKKGARLVLSFRFGFLPLKFAVTVVRSDPPKELAWMGRAGGLKGAHCWRFVSDGEKTRVIQREEYSGAGLIPFFLAGQVGAAKRRYAKALRALKALVESEPTQTQVGG